jgi:hypothetical protein
MRYTESRLIMGEYFELSRPLLDGITWPAIAYFDFHGILLLYESLSGLGWERGLVAETGKLPARKSSK